MTPTEIIAMLALAGYAVYRQTRQNEVIGKCRFKLAIIYAIVGSCWWLRGPKGDRGGATRRGSGAQRVVGLARGCLTRCGSRRTVA